MSSRVTDWRIVLSDYIERAESSEREEGAEQAMAAVRRREFMDRSVLPAFRALGEELQRHGRHVEISPGEWRAELTVRHRGQAEFHAAVRVEGGSALLVSFEEQDGHPLPVESSFAVGMSRTQDVTEEAVLLSLVGFYTQGERNTGGPSA